MRFGNTLAIVTALVAWSALALQLVLLVSQMTSEGATLRQAVWRFFGFYTILANCAVAIVATAIALGRPLPLNSPRVKLATAATIILVGIVYSVALRSVWQPTGWQAVADHALHDATPVLFFFTWAFSEHGSLRWRDTAWATLPPVAYCAYAFARGAADGWYAYWFLDPSALNLSQLAANIALILAAFTIIALILIAIDRRLARTAEIRRQPVL